MAHPSNHTDRPPLAVSSTSISGTVTPNGLIENRKVSRSSSISLTPGGLNSSRISYPGEQTALLSSSSRGPNYDSLPSGSSRRHISYQRKHSDKPGRIVPNSPSEDRVNNADSSALVLSHERIWYNQFTSTDWMRDIIADAFRLRHLRNRRDWRGRLMARFDGAQGWILAALVGVVTACTAYFITVSERLLFDLRQGYCTTNPILDRSRCSPTHWFQWSDFLQLYGIPEITAEFGIYLFGTILLSVIACLITLQSETVLPFAEAAPAIDENLGDSADIIPSHLQASPNSPSVSPKEGRRKYYTAAGSGVAEVKVVLSGFVLHGYLGLKTLILKSIGLIFSVSAGLSLGKEGPYVHISACIGNIACRLFPKYNHNDAKRREILSASAAAGVAVAFGAPIGGTLFSLEEVSYYFPPKTLFRTFFCCVVAAISLKFLNPYGTGQIVLFEVRYLNDWELFEIGIFILLGILGGTIGAMFIKASRWWANSFRRLRPIRKWPLLEVLVVAIVTGILSFWNRYTRLPVADLLLDLARPCWNQSSESIVDKDSLTSFLCPTSSKQIPDILLTLASAFAVKAVLTVITFGIKVPAGIYVPSMVVGGLLGRFVGHAIQMIALNNPTHPLFASCSVEGNPESCILPGAFGLAAAGSVLVGTTRLTITLAVILFELTGSLNHVLPFSLAILVSKWTADALEPLSIYDLLTDMNSYPFLDNKHRPLFTTDVGDMIDSSSSSPERVIDISGPSLITASELRAKLCYLHSCGELDGAFPIVRHGVLVGLIPVYDLEYALDEIKSRTSGLEFGKVGCILYSLDPLRQVETGEEHPLSSSQVRECPSCGSWESTTTDQMIHYNNHNHEHQQTQRALNCPVHPGSDNGLVSDFTPYINPAPVALDIHAPMDQAFEHFIKLGLRHLCILREGKFAGLIHKKVFAQYIKKYKKELQGVSI